MLFVYTGNGKGKTTAALGAACRALGRGKKVLMIQFIKSDGFKSGEDVSALRFGGDFKLVKGGEGFVGILGDKKPRSVHRLAAQRALDLAHQAAKSGKYDLIILDEVNVAVGLRLIKAGKALEILKNAPSRVLFIFTGRGAPKSFIKKADLVTEMKEVKHPFNKGTAAALGVEF